MRRITLKELLNNTIDTQYIEIDLINATVFSGSVISLKENEDYKDLMNIDVLEYTNQIATIKVDEERSENIVCMYITLNLKLKINDKKIEYFKLDLSTEE